uniref:Uncharacterized protein n=1 Tax=Megaviridae environmental sample TaxID=1737588 RepID=A0A5J6VJS7_9VIRU|nr:MAG: hypothetical protein [Megaviridae environmental sample]
MPCSFCNSNNHTSKNCKLEKLISKDIKLRVGNLMEQFAENYIRCNKCNHKMTMLNNHAPSLDLVCTGCQSKFEVKSKCLSVSNLPQDLVINHGNYNLYKQRQSQNLNFIIIIYGVDRKSKLITIKKVFIVPNDIIVNTNYFIVEQNTTNRLSTIYINNHYIFKNITNNIFTYNLKPFVDQKIIEYRRQLQSHKN